MAKTRRRGVLQGGDDVEESARTGSLTVVGTGIVSVGQLTLEAIGWIRSADIVCYGLAEPVTERWLVDNAREAEDLACFYDEDSRRVVSYRNMAERLLHHVRAGKRVVGVFYGHPGVFVDPAHRAIEIARREGYPAVMLPGVSAEDCLFAALGVDPGRIGCETYEATEMLMRGRRPSPDTHVIIWQIGVVGNLGFQPENAPSDLTGLAEYLMTIYPPDHLVTHYQGAQYAVCESVADEFQVRELASIQTSGASTLYIPPAVTRPLDESMLAALGIPSAPPPELADEPDGRSLPGRDWYVPLSPGRSRVADLLIRLSDDPAGLAAYEADPVGYLSAAGLDPVEQWALLSRNHRAIAACARLGSGPEAVVSMGLADDVEQARTYSVTADGRLMRPKRRQAAD
ncbi:MAG: SAM-dependent methyltransferase [Actinomycetes bacterium]